MGTAAILVMWNGSYEHTFDPPSIEAPYDILLLICPMVPKRMPFCASFWLFNQNFLFKGNYSAKQIHVYSIEGY